MSSGVVPDNLGSDSENESEPPKRPEPPKPETRDELKARLAREYEEELAKGCLNCSA
jgi:hypothetical protein